MQAPQTRRPGEAVFATAVAVASLYLLYSAYGISGFTALSAPGAIPMATTFAMTITAIIVLYRTLRTPADPERRFLRDVLPRNIIVVALMLVAYAFALKPLGFLPTSALFLVGAIKLLSARSWVFSVGIGLFTLLCIYLVFRIVFTVLMPAGIVPEGEMLAVIKSVFGGGK
jgi:putative tricarboxylic transport membrane protein